MLPFKTRQPKTETIEDGLGNSIEIPVYGSATYNEATAFYQMLLDNRGLEKPEVDQKFVTRAVVMFLRSRFKVADSVTDAEILQDADGIPIAFTLITAIYNYFYEQELTGGRKASEEYAEKKKQIGQNSTTESDSTTPTKNGSARKTSETVRLG